MNRRVSYLILVLFALFFMNCSKKQTDTVIKVGDVSIGRAEFMESLTLEPMYAIRVNVRKARNSQAKHLVQDVWFSMAAEQSGLMEDSLIKRRIDYIRRNEIKKAFIEKEILEKTQISESQFLQGFARAGKQLKVRHLFFKDSLQAAKALAKIEGGMSFNELAQSVFHDSLLKRTGGSLGYVGFGDLDPSLEDAVYGLQPGKISRIVQSSYGYHILKVDSVRQNREFLNLNTAMQNDWVKKTLQNRYSHRQMQSLLKKMAGEAPIRMNNRALKAISRIIDETLTERYGQPSLLKPPVRTSDLVSIEQQAVPLMESELFAFKGKSYKVSDFLERIRLMPPFHRPYLKGINRVASAALNLLRDDLIYSAAISDHYDRQEWVKSRIAKEVRRLLAAEFKRFYFSNDFKENYPKKWKKLATVWQTVKEHNPPEINEDLLFSDVADPDNTLAPPPIPIFLKSRYIW